MQLKLGHQQKLMQKLSLNPQMIQRAEILTMNVAELHEHVQEALLENPTMEVEDVSDRSEHDDFESENLAEEDPDLLREIERLEDIRESWKEIAEFDRKSYAGAGEKDNKLEAMLNTPEREQTLQEFLEDQLHALDITERQLEIGEYLVFNIDTRGYLQTESNLMETEDALAGHGELTEEFCAGVPVEPPATVEEVEEVLHLIQHFDPVGVGARDIRECLLIQIGLDEAYSLERQIVRDHLEDVMQNRLPKISKETLQPIELVDEAIRFIKDLNPYPGAAFNNVTTEYVVPDVTVQKRDGKWQIVSEDRYVPQLRISPRYIEMLQTNGDDPEVREYVRRKIDAAKFLIEAIERRQDTLAKIANEIIEYQEDFLETGVDALKPLKMQYIADRLGIHVSTVSRAINGKYIQTPRGIFSLRYFFKGGTTTSDGDELSVIAVKEKLKQIVDDEDKTKPLSDDKIAELLQSRFGLDVKRRTINKYRKALDIPSSRARKQYV